MSRCDRGLGFECYEASRLIPSAGHAGWIGRLASALGLTSVMESRKRTVLYGALLMLGALVGGLWVHDLPTQPLRVIGYVVVIGVAGVGFVMTLRDDS